MSILKKPSLRTIRFAIFDFDSSQRLGEIEEFQTMLFTDSTDELICRMRDYLSWTLDFTFTPFEAGVTELEMVDDGELGSNAFLDEGLWRGKPFAVLFKTE